jgi:hypothetical protein
MAKIIIQSDEIVDGTAGRKKILFPGDGVSVPAAIKEWG